MQMYFSSFKLKIIGVASTIYKRANTETTHRQSEGVHGRMGLQNAVNPCNAEIFLYKLRRPKGFFNLKSL